MTNSLALIEQLKAKAVEASVDYGPKILVALIIIIAGFFFAGWFVKVAARTLVKLRLEPPVQSLLLRLVRLVILMLFVLMALVNLEVKILPLIAGLSVAGAGIALAMQGVLGNLAAGLTIIFTRPFRIGEYIELIGVQGQVTAIELFTTTLTHPDRSKVVIPNRKIVGEVLHNYGTLRQLHLTVGVAYQTDLDLALAVVRKTLDSNQRVLKDPVAVVGVTALADSSINISVKPWTLVSDFNPAGQELYQSIIAEFRANNVQIPFPQREVRLLNEPSPKN